MYSQGLSIVFRYGPRMTLEIFQQRYACVPWGGEEDLKTKSLFDLTISTTETRWRFSFEMIVLAPLLGYLKVARVNWSKDSGFFFDFPLDKTNGCRYNQNTSLSIRKSKTYTVFYRTSENTTVVKIRIVETRFGVFRSVLTTLNTRYQGYLGRSGSSLLI